MAAPQRQRTLTEALPAIRSYLKENRLPASLLKTILALRQLLPTTAAKWPLLNQAATIAVLRRRKGLQSLTQTLMIPVQTRRLLMDSKEYQCCQLALLLQLLPAMAALHQL